MNHRPNADFSRFLAVVALSVAALAVSACRERPAEYTSGLAIESVNVIDVVEGEAREGRTVVIEDNRVVEVASASEIRLGEEVTRVDGSERFLIPGLWDMHVHAYGGEPARLLQMSLAFGVTGVRDMGATHEVFEKLKEWQQRFRAGKVPGPRIHAAGVIVDGEPRTRPHYITATNAEQAREAVDRLHEMGADLVKVYNRLPREAFYAAVEEARSRGLEVSGHAPQAVGPGTASDAGMRTIEHADDLAYAVSNRRPPADYQVEDRVRAFASYEEKKAKALSERFARNGTFFVPTLQITYGVIHYEPEDLRQGPLARLTPEEPIIPAEDLLLEITEEERPLFDRAYRNILKMVSDMHEEGVRLMAGSHAPLPFIPPGFGLHGEMVRLVEAGLTPAEALRTATLHPARYLERLDELGTVEEGKLADLVLLDANPLEDIRHTRKIEAVVMDGRLLDCDELDRLLTSVTAD